MKPDAVHEAARRVVSDHLVSTKLSAAEVKKADGPALPGVGGRTKGRHPWGLTLNLEHETLGKLGMKALPAVGSDVTVHARARVTSAEEREREGGGGKRRSVSLQVTHMAVGGKHTARTVKK
jgi:hypothetical protein